MNNFGTVTPQNIDELELLEVANAIRSKIGLPRTNKLSKGCMGVPMWCPVANTVMQDSDKYVFIYPESGFITVVVQYDDIRYTIQNGKATQLIREFDRNVKLQRLQSI